MLKMSVEGVLLCVKVIYTFQMDVWEACLKVALKHTNGMQLPLKCGLSFCVFFFSSFNVGTSRNSPVCDCKVMVRAQHL